MNPTHRCTDLSRPDPWPPGSYQGVEQDCKRECTKELFLVFSCFHFNILCLANRARYEGGIQKELLKSASDKLNCFCCDSKKKVLGCYFSYLAKPNNCKVSAAGFNNKLFCYLDGQNSVQTLNNQQ